MHLNTEDGESEYPGGQNHSLTHILGVQLCGGMGGHMLGVQLLGPNPAF